MIGIIITLPDALAARAGTSQVLVCQDEDGFCDAFADYTATGEGYDVGARLKCFTPLEAGTIRDLYDLATKGSVQPDAQSLARIGDRRQRAKRRRRGVDRKVAPIGARYEDV